MTKRKVLLLGVVGIILLAIGFVSRPASDHRSLNAMAVSAQTSFETGDLWSQIAVFGGGMVLFCLVLLQVAITLFYPAVRDQRRRMFPQMPDEPIFEALLIKEWKKRA